MITIIQKYAFPVENVFFTFALASEVADVFTEYRHLICGIGKVNAAYNLMKAIPEVTTSMHSDYLAGKRQTEVHSLTGYIVEQAEKCYIEVPKYQEMYYRLINM